MICLESNRYEKAVVALSLRRLFEYLTPYSTTATSPASHQTTFEKYELAYQNMRFWRTFLYQHVCRCTHNVEHDSDIFYDVSVCYRQWYWRCGAFYGFLITRPAQRNESIHYVPQDRSKTARKKERACGRFRSSEPPANPRYSNKKATSFSADGFWSEWRESNSRPLEPHSSALPNCATPGRLARCSHRRRCLL